MGLGKGLVWDNKTEGASGAGNASVSGPTKAAGMVRPRKVKSGKYQNLKTYKYESLDSAIPGKGA